MSKNFKYYAVWTALTLIIFWLIFETGRLWVIIRTMFVRPEWSLIALGILIVFYFVAIFEISKVWTNEIIRHDEDVRKEQW